MDSHHVFVGSQTGYLKGVSLKDGRWANINLVPKIDKTQEIVCMCWNNEYDNEVCVGTVNQTVKVYYNSGFSTEWDLSGGIDGKLAGLCKLNNNFVTCTKDGLLRVWSEDTSEKPQISKDVGPKLCCMKQNATQQNIIGTGGEENELKIWDLNSNAENIFTAKNVRNNYLNLRVPVWVLDVAFIPDSEKVITSTSYHQVRLYDTKCQKRPVISMEFGDCPISTISLANNQQVVVGNSQGLLALLDLRGSSGTLIHKFQDPTGAIKSIVCDPSQNIFACCGLDRYLRIYNLQNKTPSQKIFLKAKLNCLLLKKSLVTNPKDDTLDVPMEEQTQPGADPWTEMEVVKNDRPERATEARAIEKSKPKLFLKEQKSRKRKLNE